MNQDEYTISESFVEVGDGHTLYVQDWGNKRASTPIVFLHGGPGDSTNDGHKASFDPRSQRVIFFDQRGCGKSLPYGFMKNNTTQDLIEDIEKLATKLKLTNFILVGGSWGSCLALAYGLKYPKRVKAMVLGGIFTGSQAEIDYLAQGRWAIHFPDVWDAYLDRTPKSHQTNPSKYHYKMILGSNGLAAKKSAYACANVEAALLKLDERFTPPNFDDYDPTGIKIEVYYMANRCFLPDHYILDNARQLRMPIWLIQGRYDMVCPPVTAYELNYKLSSSHLIWTVAGHSNDRPNYDVRRTILLQMTQAKRN
ncbi:MAG: alpha/beta fold hydrolase [Candidatus Saccharimonadales bacterium]